MSHDAATCRKPHCDTCGHHCQLRPDGLCSRCRKKAGYSWTHSEHQSPDTLEENLWVNDRGIMRHPRGRSA